MALATEQHEGTAFITHPNDDLTDKKICLDIGCGPVGSARHWMFAKDDWRVIRVDANRDVSPDIVAPAYDLTVGKIADEFADAVWCKSLLDHLYFNQIQKALKEFHRVLKPDGCACIVVLDWGVIAENVKKYGFLRELYRWAPDKPISAGDQGFGNRDEIFNQGNRFMEKHWGFTEIDLPVLLEEAGFKDAKVKPSNDWMLNALYARAWK